MLSCSIHHLAFKISISKTSSLIRCYFSSVNNFLPVLQVVVVLNYNNTFCILPDWAWSTWLQCLSRVPWKIIPSVLCLNGSIPNNPDLVKHLFFKSCLILATQNNSCSFFWYYLLDTLLCLFGVAFLCWLSMSCIKFILVCPGGRRSTL